MNTPAPSQSLPPALAQSSVCNTHAPSGETRSPRSSSESLAVAAMPSRQRAGGYTGVTTAFFVCTWSADPPPPFLICSPVTDSPEGHVTSSHTTSAGHLKWPGLRTAIGLAQYFALFSSLLCWLVSLEHDGVHPLNLSLVKLCRVRSKGC